MITKFDISTFVNIDTVSSLESGMIKRFKSRRHELHISQKKLAEMSGVSYASIRRFENTGEISLTSLIKLAIAIDCQSDFHALFAHSRAKNLKDME